MKKSGQALFLILFMMAGSRDSVANYAAGARQENSKCANRTVRFNLDPTLDSSKKTHPQNKKKPGLFNQCTQYARDKVTSVQEYYNTLDPMHQNAIKFLAILAAVGALQALRGSSNGNADEKKETIDDKDEEEIKDGTVVDHSLADQTVETTEQIILTQGEVNKDKDYIINFLNNGKPASNGTVTGKDLAQQFLQVDLNAYILHKKFQDRRLNTTDIAEQYLQYKNGTNATNAEVLPKNLYQFILHNYIIPTDGQ